MQPPAPLPALPDKAGGCRRPGGPTAESAGSHPSGKVQQRQRRPTVGALASSTGILVDRCDEELSGNSIGHGPGS